MDAMRHEPKDATPATCAHHSACACSLPFADRQDFRDVERGFIASLPEVEIKNAEGRIVWSLREYAFLNAEGVPATVNS
jgi:alkyl sulfatase BDS1-like metallo-beta-lactamase superfamily hydrolase